MKTLLFFLILIILGGVGKWDNFQLGIILAILLVGFFWPFKALGKIKFPPVANIYFLFLLTYLLSFLWSKNMESQLYFFWLFAGGFILWIFAFNFLFKGKEKLFEAIVITGFFFLILSIIYFLGGKEGIGPLGLYKFTSYKANHIHMGDYWSVLTTFSLYKYLFEKRKKVWLFMVFFGIAVIFFSMSRAAIVSFIAGVIYLFRFIKKESINGKIIAIMLVLSITLLFILSPFKSLIFSRQFYFQSIAGLTTNPLGVGVGNFRYISSDPRNHIFGFSTFGLYAEGIVFEIISGLGVFGFIFIYWFFKNIIRVLTKAVHKPEPEAVMFIVLSVNFLFDYTYFVPAMIWIWFILLGINQTFLIGGKKL